MSTSVPALILTIMLVAALAGCASSTGSSLADLPGPAWPEIALADASGQATALPRTPAESSFAGNVIPRSRWTTAGPSQRDLNPMTSIRYITVHHDAMPRVNSAVFAVAAARLEQIRRAHTSERGWSDIGYHFAIDRAGRVWSARSLQYQGAHVKDHNEGNVGILLLGNFDSETPSSAQLESMCALITSLRRQFNVPLGNVKTHQDWESAATACPGRTLHGLFNSARNQGRFGR